MDEFDPELKTGLQAAAILPASLADLRKLASAFAGNSRAARTKKEYSRDWADFATWCWNHGFKPLPASPEIVALYLSARATRLKASTLKRRLAAIVVIHRCAGFTIDTHDPGFKETWRGIRRTIGTKKEGKAPLLVRDIRAIVSTLPDSLAGIRDAAVMLAGFGGALRRSEIVALDVEDVKFTAEGVLLWLCRAKTDQEAEGQWRAIPNGDNPETCPALALKKWLAATGLMKGPLFRGIDRFGRMAATRLCDRAVALIVKRAVRRFGEAGGWTERQIDENLQPISAHSLRSGLATSAAAAGANENAIMRQTGHRSREEVQRYIRIGTLFQGNVAGTLGL